VYFTTPHLSQLSERYDAITSQYKKTQSSLVKQVVQVVATYSPILEEMNGVVAVLDVLVAYVSLVVPQV
jgi:DNA mismatch repair protein MSH2